MLNTIQRANDINSLVLPSTKEQQFQFTCEGSLTSSAVWGLAYAITQDMRGDNDAEQFVERMTERVAYIASFVTLPQITKVAAEAASQMQAQRPDAEVREMMEALGGELVDEDEQAFFNNLDRDEFAKRLNSAIEYAYRVDSDDSTAVELWVANKVLAYSERQYLKLSEFQNASQRFKVAWCRAHGTEIRKQARSSKLSIADATISYVEGILASIGRLLDELSAIADATQEQFDDERELANDANHVDHQHS